jgi:hypothetical protein
MAAATSRAWTLRCVAAAIGLVLGIFAWMLDGDASRDSTAIASFAFYVLLGSTTGVVLTYLLPGLRPARRFSWILIGLVLAILAFVYAGLFFVAFLIDPAAG